MTASVKIETILRGTRRSRAVKRGHGAYSHAWIPEATIVVEADNGDSVTNLVDLIILEQFNGNIRAAQGEQVWSVLGYYLPSETPPEEHGVHNIEFESMDAWDKWLCLDDLKLGSSTTSGPHGVTIRNALCALEFFYEATHTCTTIRLVPSAQNEPVQTVWVRYLSKAALTEKASSIPIKRLPWWRRWNLFSRRKLPKALLQKNRA